MKTIIAPIILLLAASSGFAQTTWNIDNVHSKVGFSVTHMAVAETEGRFNDYSGSLLTTKGDSFDGAEVTFSAKTASIDTENGQRDGHLKSPDFFDAEKYPEITFKGKLSKSGATYKLKGDLTLHGVTKPVEFEVTGGNQVDTGRGFKSGFKFKGTINRKDYGLTWANKTPGGEMVVSDEVELNMKIELNKQA